MDRMRSCIECCGHRGLRAAMKEALDPVDLAAASLGAYVRAETVTALRRASSATQAVALLLMSPEFQRR